jgi:uncharacterized protein
MPLFGGLLMKRNHDEHPKDRATNQPIDRREFLKRGALAGIGVGLMAIASEAGAAIGPPTRVRRYVPLGKTGLKISDISFGSSRLRLGQEDLVNHAFDSGINYFDTAADYAGGDSETTLGNALKGKRDKVVLTSKVFAYPDDRRDQIMQVLEGSLRRLQTDHVDLYFNHAVNDVARLKNPEWYEFIEQARRQGKLRFTGMSGHAGNLAECLEYAIDSGHYDVILAVHNFGQDPAFYKRFFHNFDFIAIQPELPRLLAKAKAKGIGTVVMKTLMGARLNDMKPYETGGATFSQAAFRWVLSGGNVDALIVSMTSRELIDEYLGASGWRHTVVGDTLLLRRYMALNSASYCRHGCNVCETSCPYDVPISEVLRTRMYARDYRDLDLARREYAMLAINAAACLTCSAKPCATACPIGIPTAEVLAPTHQMLT